MSPKRRKDSKRRVLHDGEYERSNGTFEYRWRDKRGKSHSVYAKTLEELREKEADVQTDVLSGISVVARELTINDVYEKWKQLKKGLKGNTFRNYSYTYERFVARDFGKMRVTDLKRSDVRGFYIHLIEKRGMKTASVECVHTVLHQVLELAVADDIIRYNPADNALTELKRAHMADSEKRRALTMAEQQLFEEFLQNSVRYRHWAPIFTVMLWTGMRVGEVTGLRWADIDLDEGVISVNHTLVFYSKGEGNGGCVFAINTPKTKAGERMIPMLPKVREAFLQERLNQEELGIECQAVIDGYSDFIFVNRFGSVQHFGTLNRALNRIVRDCNQAALARGKGKPDTVLLPKFSNHTLRHTFTTRMCEAGINIKAMQEILGHADSQTTLDVYTDATRELKQREMIRLEEYFQDADEE